jgi:hypothetical protein
MTVLILALSALITVSATIPYLLDAIKGKTKPRVVSWFNWALLTGISAAAALSVHQYPSAVLSLAASVECWGVVVVSLRKGDRSFELFDLFCQMGAIAGLVLWIIFNSPLIAIAASIVIDIIVSAPTVKHIWQKPYEESANVFILSAVGAALALLAIHHPKPIGLINPLYLILINCLMSLLFLMTPNRRPNRKALG